MGKLLDIIQQSFPPKATWTAQNIPDLTGQVCLVTGGGVGIGKETARRLLEHNATVYIATRNEEKANNAIKELQEQTGKTAKYLKLDLASFSSIETAANEFQTLETRLDVLFNNAGVMEPPIEQLTPEGYDEQFGINVIGPFYLTKLLLPVLLASAKSSLNGKVRVVNTASGMHLLNELDYRKCARDGDDRRKAGTVKLYALSKFNLVVWSKELGRRYGDKGIVSIALHPGVIRTDLHRHMHGFRGLAVGIMEKTILHDVEHGAITQLFAGTSPEALEMNGQYLIPWARVGKAHKETDDAKQGSALYEWLEQQVAQRSV